MTVKSHLCPLKKGTMWSVPSFISIFFLKPGSHPFVVFMPFSTIGNHGFIVALNKPKPKKQTVEVHFHF